MPSGQKNLLLLLAILLVMQGGINLFKYFSEINQGAAFGGDFMSFWHAAQMLGRADLQAIYDTEALVKVMKNDSNYLGTTFVYPPHALFLLWPLQYLTYNQAVALWSLLPLLLYYWWVITALRRSALPSDTSTYAIVCISLLPFLMANLFTGQTGTLIALFFLVAIWGWNRSPVIAGIALGLMTIKPQLGLLLPFALIAAGKWRIAFAALGTATIMIGLTTLWLGTAIWGDYFRMASLYGTFLNNNFQDFSRLALAPYISLHSVDIPAGIAAMVQGIITVLGITLIMRVFRSLDDRQDLRFGLLACGALLVPPYAMVYDSPLLAAAIMPLLLRACHSGWRDLWEVLAFAAIISMPYAQPLLMQYHLPFGLAALLCFSGVMYRRYHEQGAHS